MKKKLTRIESQSSLRTLVIGASTRWPAISKATRSPTFRPKVCASPASTENCGSAAAPCQRPDWTTLPEGSAAP